MPRGIFVNGKEVGWGYEAPKDGVGEAIHKALERLKMYQQTWKPLWSD